MAAYTAQQVSVSNGYKVVTINSAESIANVRYSDFLVLNNHIVEINRAYVGADGKQYIELVKNWPYSTQTNQPCIVIPTTGDFAAAVQALKDAQVLVNDNFQTMHDWQTKSGMVTFQHPDGTSTTVKTLADALAVQRQIATLEEMFEGTATNTLVTPFNFKNALEYYLEEGGFGSGGGSDRESSRLYLADYVEDPQSVADVDAGFEALNAKLSQGMTIDLSGDYVWPTKTLNTNGVNRLKITGGSFSRTSPTFGVEYIIRVQLSENTLITGVTLDGASVGTNWGSQGIYVSRSRNTIIMGNHFKDIGDGVIRYAYKPQSGAGNPVTSTDGLVITGNTFENCQQVTSNATGGKNVIISSNSFINSAIKITQAVPGESGWTIITANTFRDSAGDAPITMQGGGNLMIHDNTIDNCAGLFNFYPNNGPLYGDNIVNSNVYVINNICRTALGERMIYGEVRGGQAPNSIIPIEGDLLIVGNTLERLAGYTSTLSNTIGLYCYVPNANLAKNVVIEDNHFKGDHRTLVQFGGDNAHYIPSDGRLSISNNRGKSTYQAFNINAEAISFGLGVIQVERNEVECPQFLTGNFLYKNGPLELFSVRQNIIRIRNSGGIFTSQINLVKTALTPVALTTKVIGNELDYLDNTGDGYVFTMAAPRTSDQGNYQFIMKDNLITTKDGSQGIRPMYVRSNPDSKPFAILIFNNNICEIYPISNTLSHDSNVPETAVTFITAQTPSTQLVASTYSVTGTQFVHKKTWSDGRQVQTGVATLSYASPASGNIYISPAAPDENYTVQITPRHPTPLLFTVAGQTKSGFQPRFSDVSGAEVLAEFAYTAEWYN